MNSAVQVVDTTQGVEELIAIIPSRDDGPPALFVDHEGNNLSRHGTISLVTIPVQSQTTVYLVDITTLGIPVFMTQTIDGRTLKSILQSSEIKKVFSDIRNDFNILYCLYGVKVADTIDLQLMELASRTSSKRCVNGLARCFEQDAGLSNVDRQAWRAVKGKGKRRYAPEL